MKIIDTTPFKGPDGQISAVDRVRAIAKYGSSWYSDVQAQDATAALLGRQLDRTYTLLVNPLLPGTDVFMPLVLVGPAGVYLIYVTNERGVFRAKGDEWGTLSGERFTPAKVNLLTRTARLAQGLGKFLERQGIPLVVEPVLLAMNPGMHIDSVRPLIRVVMSDAVERFAIGVTQASRTLTLETAAAIVDRIQKPHSTQKAGPAHPSRSTLEGREGEAPAHPREGAAPAGDSAVTPVYTPQGYGDASAASAPAQSGEPAPLDADSLGFAFNDEVEPEVAPPKSPQPGAAKKPSRRGAYFSLGQWIALGALFLIFVLLLTAIIVLAVMNA
jgi:hypothetical protein